MLRHPLEGTSASAGSAGSAAAGRLVPAPRSKRRWDQRPWPPAPLPGLAGNMEGYILHVYVYILFFMLYIYILYSYIYNIIIIVIIIITIIIITIIYIYIIWRYDIKFDKKIEDIYNQQQKIATTVRMDLENAGSKSKRM